MGHKEAVRLLIVFDGEEGSKMKSKKAVFSLSILFFVLSCCSTVWAKGQYVHPRNKVLMMLHPDSPYPFKWPEVPRFTAAEALNFYRAGNAFFIHIGHDGATIPGAINLSEDKAWSVQVKSVAAIAKGRVIILY